MGTLQETIREYLRKNEPMTINNIKALTGLDTSSVSNALRALRRWDEVERELNGKYILWRIKK